jgi:transcriptional regulator with XRE-family HTH domain
MILSPSTMGAVLREIRKKAGLTQQTLGTIVGLTGLGAMSNVELGKRETTTRVLLAWADACGFDVLVLPRDRPPAVELADLDPLDQRLFATLLARWADMPAGERNLIRAQLEYVRSVSPSGCQEDVKAGD